MTKISQYPEISTPDVNDLLIGTDVENSNATKNFLISDILSLGMNVAPTLQQVTTVGAITTTPITANSFIKTGGTSSQFLKANGSIDSNTYALASAVPSIPYKVYSALISQSGTSAPTLVVLQNTLGDTITPLYNSIGNYTLQLDTLNLFAFTKTFILLNSSYSNNAYLGIVRGNDSELLVKSTFNGSNSNNVILDASIEIRVYE